MADEPLTSLTLFDYSDRELLLLIGEVAMGTDDGHATTREIANALGLEGEYRLNSVGSRLGYLKRIGAVKRAEFEINGARWSVTPEGMALASGKLTVRASNALNALRDEHLLLFTRAVASRIDPDSLAGRMTRREFRRGIGGRL